MTPPNSDFEPKTMAQNKKAQCSFCDQEAVFRVWRVRLTYVCETCATDVRLKHAERIDTGHLHVREG